MRLLWLAEDCRAAGLTVKEIPGWQARGVEFAKIPNTVLAHHTATPKTARGDLPTQKILIEGRSPDNPKAADHLPGPLCQVALGRNGTVYVVASGKANQAGKGAWRGTTSSAETIGIEAEHPGVGDWPDKQYEAYVRLVAVLLRGLGQGSERVCGHKEWATPPGRKTDPNFDMARFRVEVARKLTGHPKPGLPSSTKEWDEMASKEEIKAVMQEVVDAAVTKLLHGGPGGAALVATHDDVKTLIRGTADGRHPNNLDNIGKAVGVPQ